MLHGKNFHEVSASLPLFVALRASIAHTGGTSGKVEKKSYCAPEKRESIVFNKEKICTMGNYQAIMGEICPFEVVSAAMNDTTHAHSAFRISVTSSIRAQAFKRAFCQVNEVCKKVSGRISRFSALRKLAPG